MDSGSKHKHKTIKILEVNTGGKKKTKQDDLRFGNDFLGTSKT
jgi:hypothetical protein